MDKELLNDIAKAVFDKPFLAISWRKRESAFVRHQVKCYSQYQDLVREKALPIMDKKKLSTREYNIIREWFFKRVPAHVVLKAIDACLENSRATGRAIYSLAFFKAHVAGEFRHYLRQQVGSRIFGDPWGYHEWQG